MYNKNPTEFSVGFLRIWDLLICILVVCFEQ